ncbi:unnamed protein product, partial [Effrenium voratum]
VGEATYQAMDLAPEAARKVAEDMAKAAPHLEQLTVCVSESEENGEVIVIANASAPVESCLFALGILANVDSDDSGCEEMDVHECATWKPAYFTGNETFNGLDEEQGELVAITQVMARELKDHFIFSFDDRIVTAPMIWGGYASDGCIVGVLSARVWT